MTDARPLRMCSLDARFKLINAFNFSGGLMPGLTGVERLRVPSCFEVHKRIVFDSVRNFNRPATNLAIFDVGLARNRRVQHHRNVFPAIGAREEVLHCGDYCSNGRPRA